MRYLFGSLTLLFLTGCAGSPPKPPLPTGEYRPINVPAAPVQQNVFNFSYEGDILGALPALKEVAPHIDVMPTLGQASPLPVRLKLSGVSLEDALRAIGAQGGGVADVVWTTNRHHSSHQVFIRFRTPLEPTNKNQAEPLGVSK